MHKSSSVALRGPLYKWLGIFGSLMFGAAPSLADTAQVFDVYEYRGKDSLDAAPISIKIPADLITRKPTTTRVFGVNILTFYPSFTSLKDPQNAAFGAGCVGICNGRILIGIKSRTHSIDASTPNMGDWMAKSHLKWHKTPPYRSNVEVTDIDVAGTGFTEAFEVKTRDPVSKRVASTQIFYLRKSARSNHFDLTASCAVGLAITGCTLNFSLACEPAVYVAVHGIDRSNLQEAADIKEETDQFISKMVLSPSCSN
jgi:hypothetical protein